MEKAISKEDKKFLEDIKWQLTKGLKEVAFICNDYSFLIEPCDKLQVWRNYEMIAEYNTFDELINNFTINGKTFIEQIEDIDYDE